MPHPLAHPGVISAMLAPALLMAATGSLLISANARLARVVDRLRALLAIEGTTGWDAARERALAEHRRRAALVLRACRLLHLALGCFVGTSLALAADALFAGRFGILATAVALLGTLCLLLASAAMGLEVSLAVRSLDAELDEAEARRRAP